METEEIDRVTASILAQAARDCAAQDIAFYAKGTPKQRMLARLPERPCGDALDRLGMRIGDITAVSEFDACLADIQHHGITAPAAIQALEKARNAIGFDPTGYIVGRMMYDIIHSVINRKWNPSDIGKYKGVTNVSWLHLVTTRIEESQFRNDVTHIIDRAVNEFFNEVRRVPRADELQVAVGAAIARLLAPKVGSSASPSAAEKRMEARRIARAHGVLHVLSDADIDTIAGVETGDKKPSTLPLEALPAFLKNPIMPVRTIAAGDIDIISATDHMLRQIIEIDPTTMLSIPPPGKRTSGMAQDFPLLALPMTWATSSNACVFPSLALSSFFNDISNTATALLKETAGATGAAITVERCASTLFIAPATEGRTLPPLPVSPPPGSPGRRWFTAVVNLSDELIRMIIVKGSGSEPRALKAGQMIAIERPEKWHIVPTPVANRAKNDDAQVVYMCVTIAISASAKTDDTFGIAMQQTLSMPAIAPHIFHVAKETIDGADDSVFKGVATKSCALYATESALVGGGNGLKLRAMKMMQRKEIEFEYGQIYVIIKPSRGKRGGTGMIAERTPKNPWHIREKRYFEPYDKEFVCPGLPVGIPEDDKELVHAVDNRRNDGKLYESDPVVVVYPRYMPSPINYVGLLPDAERFRHLVHSDAK